jgi:tetratricopeptide (TPR) repeat protein
MVCTRTLVGLAATVLLHSNVAMAESASQGQPETARTSGDWKQIRTPSLLVLGNARTEDLRRTAREIERFRATIRALNPKIPLDSPEPTVAVVLRDNRTLTPFKPRVRGKPNDNVAAYFAPFPDVNYIVLAPLENRQVTYQVIFHEYSHLFVHRTFPRLPRWLDEGLAEFYSTFGSEEDGRLIIGRPIPWHLTLLRDGGALVALEKFVDPDSLPQLLRDGRSTNRFYAQAWILTHYLIVGEKGAYRPKLAEFIAAMQRGEPEETAFASIFGDLESLERGLRTYVQAVALPAVRLPEVEVPPDGAVERLLEVDAQYIQGDLLIRQGAYEDGEKYLARALALDPTHVASRLAQARSLLRRARVSDALDILNAPDIEARTDFGTTFLSAEVLRAAGRYDQAIDAYRQAIALMQDSPFPYYGLSMAQLAAGRPEAAANFLRCVQIRPDPRWYDTRLHESQYLGLDTFAISDAVNFVNQAGWQDGHSPYVMYIAALTALRLKEPDRADRLLQEIEAHVESSSWQALIVAFLRGRIKPEAFLAKASPDELLTEAHAYIGIKANIEGDRETALVHLRWVKDKGRRDYTEYGLALGELKRIERESSSTK